MPAPKFTYTGDKIKKRSTGDAAPKFTFVGSEKKWDGANLLSGALSASLSTLTKPPKIETPKPSQPTPTQINRQDAAMIQSGVTRPSVDQQRRDHFAQSHPEYTGGMDGARTRAINTGWVNATTELKKTREEVDKLQSEPVSPYLTGGTPQVATPYAPGLQVKRAREEQGSELSRTKNALKEAQGELTAWTMLRNEERVQQAVATVTKDPFAVTTALKKVREMPLDKLERRRAEQDVRGALYASILQSDDFKNWDGSYDRYGQNLDIVTSEAMEKAGQTPVATEEEERLLDYLIYKSKTDPAWRDNEDLTPNQYYQWWSATIGDPRAGRRQAEKAKDEGLLGGAKMVLNSTARSMDDAWAGLFGVERSLSADDYAVAEYRDSLEGVPRIAFDAANTIANMAPSMAVGAALGPQAGLVTMAANAGGRAVQQSLQEGHGLMESYGYGALTAASEAMLGRLLGGIANVGGGNGLFSSIAGESVENIKNGFLRFAAKVGLNAADEALEEYNQGLLDPVFRNIMLGEDNEITLISEDAAYDAFMALLTTPFLEGPHQARVEIDRGRALSDWGGSIRATGMDNTAVGLDVLTTMEGEAGKPMAQDVSAPETQQKTVSTGETGIDPGARKTVREIVGELPSGDYEAPYVAIPSNALVGDDGGKLPVSKIPAAIRRYMIKLFRGKVLKIGADHKVYISREGVKEFSFPVKRMDEGTKMAKMAAGANLDTTLEPAVFLLNTPDDGRHPKATGGWDNFYVMFRTDTGLYSGIVKTMATDRGREFYDITEIRREGDPSTHGDSELTPPPARTDAPSKFSIPQVTPAVKAPTKTPAQLAHEAKVLSGLPLVDHLGSFDRSGLTSLLESHGVVGDAEAAWKLIDGYAELYLAGFDRRPVSQDILPAAADPAALRLTASERLQAYYNGLNDVQTMGQAGGESSADESTLQSAEEKGTIDKITSDQLEDEEVRSVLGYKSSESYKLNAVIRDGLDPTPEQQQMIERLDTALRKLPVYQGRVYRRMSFDLQGPEALEAFLAEHQPGSYVRYPAYTSASTLSDGYPVEGDLIVTIIIESKSARDMNGFGNNFENEVLFSRSGKFLVERTETDVDGKPIIYVREVESDG